MGTTSGRESRVRMSLAPPVRWLGLGSVLGFGWDGVGWGGVEWVALSVGASVDAMKLF